MSDYGAKISKAGVDVKSANNNELLYSSKWTNLKIYNIYTDTITISGTSGSTTRANPLSYPPLYMVFFDVSAGSGDYRPMTMAGTVYYDNVSLIPGGCTSEYRSATDDFLYRVNNATNGQVYTVKTVVFLDRLY